MKASPLFSIFTVCLNAEAHLANALESVLVQSRDDYEYIVADGGSVDRTLDILREYEPRFAGRMRWVSEPDEGLYDAMNRALGRATGHYVEFLGADDRLRPGALEAVARVLYRTPRPEIVFGGTHVFGADGAWDEPARHVFRRGLDSRVPASHQSMFVRREVLDRAEGFDLRYKIAADYDLYLRLIDAGCKEVLIDEVLSEFQLGGASSRRAAATAREYRDVRVAHGANALVEDFVMLKSTLAAIAFAGWMKLFGRAPGSTGATP